MLKLPDVTLIMIETRQHELANYAIDECVKRVYFGDILLFTNKPELYKNTPASIFPVPDWPEKIGWCRWTWQGMVEYVRTSHALCIQWDSWVTDPSMWRDEYLQYDYIGAPWWYKDGKNVGNGGFCLRSYQLMHYLRKHRDVFPCTDTLDDDLLCRKYRPKLQDQGFTWAPEHVAADFSFECIIPNDHPKSFGFHAMHNWGFVLTREELIERALIASKIEYITKNSWMWAKLNERNPWLASALEKHEANPVLI